MGRYILRRLIQLVPVLLGISLLVFAFLHLIPGDPAVTLLGDRVTPEAVEQLRERMGLNQPLPLQYLSFLGSLLSFDLGTSIFTGVPILDEIKLRWPATFELSVVAMLIALLLGIPAGVIAAVKKNSLVDNLTMSGSLLGVSMPVYWLGLLLVYLFAVNLQWLPPSGRIGIDAGYSFQPITGFFIFDALIQGDFAALGNILSHLVLPAVTLSPQCHARSALTRLHSYGQIQRIKRAYGDWQARLKECDAAGRDDCRARVWHAFRGRYSHRDHLFLARNRQLDLRRHFTERLSGRSGRRSLCGLYVCAGKSSGRSLLRVFRPSHSVQVIGCVYYGDRIFLTKQTRPA